DVTYPLLDATRERPDILPVYVSLTSGEPTPQTKRGLDAPGAGAPLLRGAVEAFTAIASVARWEGARQRRLDDGPWRTAWPQLAADRRSFATETAEGEDRSRAASPRADRPDSPGPSALPERESLELLRAAGLAVTPAVAVPDADAAVEAARPLAGHAVALKLDAIGLAHKRELRGVVLRLGGDEVGRQAGPHTL